MNSGGRYNYMTAETSESDSVKAADKFNDENERVKAMSLTDLSSQKEMTQYVLYRKLSYTSSR